jgi:hypothetical protein
MCRSETESQNLVSLRFGSGLGSIFKLHCPVVLDQTPNTRWILYCGLRSHVVPPLPLQVRYGGFPLLASIYRAERTAVTSI